MKKVFFLCIIVIIHFKAFAQKESFNTLNERLFIDSLRPPQVTETEVGTGLIPKAIFDSVIMRDYTNLGIVKSSLPQTSIILDLTEKKMNFNFSKFIGSASMLNNHPVALTSSVTFDFDNEAKQSAFITQGKLTPNIVFSGGAKFFLFAKAKYWGDEKKRVQGLIAQLNGDKKKLTAYNKKTIEDSICRCKDVDSSTYYCKILRAIPTDTCITKDNAKYSKFLDKKVEELATDIYRKADFSKKIYRWFDVNLDYSRPSINTLNRQSAIGDRLKSTIYNNVGFMASYNVLSIYEKISQYFIYSIKYSNSDNSAFLKAEDVSILKNIDTLGTTAYYETKAKKAYDTTSLKVIRSVNVGIDYYYFFKKVIGFTAGIHLTFSDDADKERKINFGILFPVVKKDKTKTVLTLYYSMTSSSPNIISGRYPGELGFKIGVPLDMFANDKD